MKSDQEKNQPQEEKIVSLNEDSKFHEQEDKSYQKLMNEQAAFSTNAPKPLK